MRNQLVFNGNIFEIVKSSTDYITKKTNQIFISETFSENLLPGKIYYYVNTRESSPYLTAPHPIYFPTGTKFLKTICQHFNGI